MTNNYLTSVQIQFKYYKGLGDKSFDQLEDKDIRWCFNEESNSIGIIVKHLAGNMLSRWTNFKTEDGEKKWRHRDSEFSDPFLTKSEMLSDWKKGWKCLFDAMDSLEPNNLSKIIYIRKQGHTITEAIQRQLCHYSYHIGQIVYISKMIKDKKWQTLSIAKNTSSEYNQSKFNENKKRKHFTDDD